MSIQKPVDTELDLPTAERDLAINQDEGADADAE